MIIAVADTHAVIWYLAADLRLSATAKSFMETAAKKGNEIAVSSITLIEMVYLVEKGRIQPQHFTRLAHELSEPSSMFREIVIDLKIARMMPRVDIKQIPDMPDRIIAATALQLDVPLISRDGKIKLSDIETLW